MPNIANLANPCIVAMFDIKYYYFIYIYIYIYAKHLKL